MGRFFFPFGLLVGPITAEFRLAKRAVIRHFAFEVGKAFVDERRLHTPVWCRGDVDRERALPEQKGERSYYAHQCH